MNPKDYAHLLYEVLEGKDEDQQTKILLRFRSLLIKNKDAHLVGAIEKDLQKIQEQKGRENITYIASSSELSGSQRQELESIFAGPREFSVNPDLLGGVAVRQKDRVHNSTLRKKLELLKSNL